MSGFQGQFTSIKNLSDRRRLPRLNKIRLGFKIKKGTSEYPAELPFFLLPAEVASLYGFKTAEDALAKAKEMGCTREDVLNFIRGNYNRMAESIEIMFPINSIEVVMPAAYKYFGSSRGVKCQGNGEYAYRSADAIKDGNPTIIPDQVMDGKIVQVECPCGLLKSDDNPKGPCTQRASLRFMIPQVNMGGIYEIPFSSVNSIIDIQSGLDYISGLTMGRFCMIPLKLRRIPTQTHHDGKQQVHFTMQVLFNVDINTLNQLRDGSQRVIAQSSTFILPPPEEVNPETESADVIEDDASPEDEPKTQFTVIREKIEACATLACIKDAWDEVTAAKNAGTINPADYASLSTYKDKQKNIIDRADAEGK